MFNFKVGASYSFDTHAPAILGNTVKNAVLTGQLDYRLASMFEGVDAKQAAVVGYLPPGTPSDPRAFTYLVFEVEAGGRLILAYPWINEASIVATTTSTLIAEVANTDINDARRIKEILNLAGYHQVTITLKDA